VELLVVVNRRGLWQLCVRVYKLQLHSGGSQLSHTKTVVDKVFDGEESVWKSSYVSDFYWIFIQRCYFIGGVMLVSVVNSGLLVVK